MVLIHVKPITIAYLRMDTPKPVAMFRIAKAMVTGSEPDVGDLRHVTEHELARGHSVE